LHKNLLHIALLKAGIATKMADIDLKRSSIAIRQATIAGK
jgi:hypothetical protein